MKKVLSIVLALSLVLSAMSMTAFAANGPSTASYGGWYLAYISFYEIDDEGKGVTDDDGYSKTYSAYGANTVKNEMENAVYDKETNTLTLTDFKGDNYILETNVMGDDFTIVVNGECSIAAIKIWGDRYGGGLTIKGDGTLTVNSKKIFDTPIALIAEGADSNLNFGAGVIVKAFSKETAILVTMVPYDDVEHAITFAADNDATVMGEPYAESYGINLEGFCLDDDYASGGGFKIVNSNDTDGIYGAYEYGSFDDNENWVPTGYQISKYVYIEKYKAYLVDRDFKKAHGDEWGYYRLPFDEFEESGYSVVYDEYQERVDNEFRVYGEGLTLSKYEDKDGNPYGVYRLYNESGPDFRVFTYEPIEEFENFYCFTKADDVKFDDLTESVEEHIIDGIFVYTVAGEEFTYDGSSVVDTDTDITSETESDIDTTSESDTDIASDSDTQPEEIKGDISGDENLDITDVVISRAYIVGNKDLTPEQIAAGDMNGDKVLDIIDVVMMRKAIVG